MVDDSIPDRVLHGEPDPELTSTLFHEYERRRLDALRKYWEEHVVKPALAKFLDSNELSELPTVVYDGKNYR